MRVKATLVEMDQRFVYQFVVACSECKILMYTHPVYLDEFPLYNEELKEIRKELRNARVTSAPAR